MGKGIFRCNWKLEGPSIWRKVKGKKKKTEYNIINGIRKDK